MFVNSSQQMAENKLLLLYVFKQLDMPIIHSQLTDFVMENDIMNYFMFQQFLSELKESRFVEEDLKDDKLFYSITEKGSNTLDYFLDRLPSSILTKINELIIKKKPALMKSSEIIANYVKLGDSEFTVKLQIIENGGSIIDVSLNVPNNKQAREICDNWRNNALETYKKIIELLV